MNKLVSFSEWLQVRDPELYENFTPLKSQILGGIGALGLGAGAYMGGMFGGGGEAPKMPPAPAPHVRSIGDEFKGKIPVAPPKVTQSRDNFGGKMPAEPPSIPKNQTHEKWDTNWEMRLFRALREAGIKMRDLRASGIPHGQEIDVDGDGQPNNPTTNYFNTGDRTFYGKGGKALWTFDGHEIHQVR